MPTSYYSGTAGQHRNQQFNSALAKSESTDARALCDTAYRLLLGDRLVGVHREPSLHIPGQVDALLTHASRQGELQVLCVEEKFRPAARGRHTGQVIKPRDMLLEYAHVWPDGSPKCDGWLWLYPADTLYACAWEATGWVLTCMAGQLQDATRRNWDAWMARYPTVRADNRIDGRLVYTSLSLAVPFRPLLRDVPGCRLVDTRRLLVSERSASGRIETRRLEAAR